MSDIDITLDLRSSNDRARLRGWVDATPRLMCSGSGALSDFWRDVVVGLLMALDESDTRRGEER